ncbi:type I 3-dehydroquinate dehydratase [Candidatus Saccharibacteria bacterium]|nr:type I 3-dehydroquinate dehydratase [Candidatus Saccharibacteria bacterium]
MSRLADRLVAVVAEPTVAACVEQFRRLPQQILTVEWRLDYLNELNYQAISEAINLVSKEVIITLRSISEGGNYTNDGDEDSRSQLLINLSNLMNVRYVDIDINNTEIIQLLPASKRLLSFHDFGYTPDNHALMAIVDAAIRQDAAIIKLACFVKDDIDISNLFNLFSKYPQQKLAIIAMSEQDNSLRTDALWQGSVLMFAATGSSVAPGQMSVDAMLEVIEKGE